MHQVTIPYPLMTRAMSNGSWNGKPFTPKVFYNSCSDILANMPDRNAFFEWIKDIETFIVCDPFMTDTARYADYVLPASFWFESEDVYNCGYGSHPYLHFCNKVIDPLYESKSDFEIYNLLLEALGLDDAIIDSSKD